MTVTAGLAGAAVYSDWLALEPIIGPQLSPVRSYISELGALTMPHHAVVNAFEMLSGVCILLFAVGLSHLLPASRQTRLGGLALGAFGLATVLTGIWPMTCAPSLDPACPAGGPALHAPRQDLATTALSVAANVAVLASMLWLATALASRPGWQRAAATGRLLLLTATPLLLAVGLLGLLDGPVGLPQRALVVLQSAWIAVLAVAAAGQPRVRPGRRDGSCRPPGGLFDGTWVGQPS